MNDTTAPLCELVPRLEVYVDGDWREVVQIQWRRGGSYTVRIYGKRDGASRGGYRTIENPKLRRAALMGAPKQPIDGAWAIEAADKFMETIERDAKQ